MECRIGCGACCIAPSISSALPGLPDGKPAGFRCPHLDEANRCRLWGTEAFPDVCRKFRPQRWVCGESRDEAIALIAALERVTSPGLRIPGS